MEIDFTDLQFQKILQEVEEFEQLGFSLIKRSIFVEEYEPDKSINSDFRLKFFLDSLIVYSVIDKNGGVDYVPE
ncbi:hypothetical protein HC766_03375 [Candidatus Gracilibacteria bacterium]|nr:hypothetical protein [Candidatus Gracilibacteria bacterium]NJS41393.1 hypothetical protein [Candidatus Gracilibacteria bacterium]